MELSIEECRDGGGAVSACNLANHYGYDLPTWLFKKLYSQVTKRNLFLKHNSDLDLREKDLNRKLEFNENQLTFTF